MNKKTVKLPLNDLAICIRCQAVAKLISLMWNKINVQLLEKAEYEPENKEVIKDVQKIVKNVHLHFLNMAKRYVKQNEHVPSMSFDGIDVEIPQENIK